MRNQRRKPHRKDFANFPRRGWDGVTARAIGEVTALEDHYYSKCHIRVFADWLRENPTPEEAAFEKFLLKLNGGVLRGMFKSQHMISGKWIVDFFFPKIRLTVEIDGPIHQEPEQMERDREKEEDCARFDITLIRITNEEVRGNKDALTQKLRDGWRQALNRENKIIGKASWPQTVTGGAASDVSP
jgi:very-short-patch-repair endonuclease